MLSRNQSDQENLCSQKNQEIYESGHLNRAKRSRSTLKSNLDAENKRSTFNDQFYHPVTHKREMEEHVVTSRSISRDSKVGNKRPIFTRVQIPNKFLRGRKLSNPQADFSDISKRRDVLSIGSLENTQSVFETSKGPLFVPLNKYSKEASMQLIEDPMPSVRRQKRNLIKDMENMINEMQRRLN